jgi:hypothetical protein
MKKVALIAFLIAAFLFIAKDRLLVLRERSVGSISTLERVSTITVSQVVEFPSGEKKKDVSLLVPEGTTALDLLTQTNPVVKKGEGSNAFITTIGKKQADDAKHEYWSFYVNGKPSSIGAGSYKLKSNDMIIWKIKTY